MGGSNRIAAGADIHGESGDCRSLTHLLKLLLAFLLAIFPVAAHAAVPVGDPAAEPSAIEAPVPGSIALEQDSNADERIAARLTEIFANVPSLAGVTVAVAEGVVTLDGIAPDDEAITRAQAIAAGVDGVVTVESNVERDVSVDLGENIDGVEDRLASIWRMVPLAGLALIVALGIAAFGYLLASLSGLWQRIAPNAFLAELIASALRFSFVVIGIVIALDMIGAGALMGAVLGGAGVIGIALGFAMRDTVENYVASLMLSLRQPFRANDHVLIDGHEGHVIRLTSRATVLLTLDGNHLRIPNSTVFKGVILNYTRNPQRRFDFTLGVDADDDAEAARQLGRDTLAAMPFVMNDPAPEVHITEVGDSNVLLRFQGWVDQRESDFNKAKSRAIGSAKVALEEAGFALPEPIYRLRFDQRTATLPFQNVGEGAIQPHQSPPTPTQSPAPSAPADEDVTPEDEIARMVEEERREGDEAGNDLLDSGRPVE